MEKIKRFQKHLESFEVTNTSVQYKMFYILFVKTHDTTFYTKTEKQKNRKKSIRHI